MSEVYLVSEIFASFWGGPERIHGGRYDGGRGLLVVEDRECGGDQDGEEDGNSAHPAHAILWDI